MPAPSSCSRSPRSRRRSCRRAARSVSILSSRFGPIEGVCVQIASDLRFALRIVARRPTVPLLVAGLFALGVGLASGMWAVVDAAILRPLPYRAGDRLVAVMETHPQRGRMAVTPANFLDWAHRVTSLQDVAGTYTIDVSVAGAGIPARVSGTKVTESFFELV